MVPKIESFSQGPMIAFYENLKGKDVYVTPVDMKSYAQYFYSEVQPLEEGSALATYKKQLLLEHDADPLMIYLKRIKPFLTLKL